MSRRPTIAACIVAATLGSLTACTSTPRSDAEGPVVPAYDSVATAHNLRVARLGQIESRGVVELSWTDEEGDRHLDQGDLDLWIRLPVNVSLRISKLGDDFMWVGCDAQRYWFFDLTGDERVLHVSRHTDADSIAGLPLPVRPLALIDLMGLTPLPTEGNSLPVVERDDIREAWVVTAAGHGGGPMRLYLDWNLLLPVRVELLGPDGGVTVAADHPLRRYRSVETPGVPVLDWPKLSTLADVGEPDGESTIKLGLQDPTTGVDVDLLERVLDLDTLRRSVRPDRIIETPAAAAARR